MKSLIAKRSVVIDGHKTSVSLEDEFWTEIKRIAFVSGMTVASYIASIDHKRTDGNLSCALRLAVLADVNKTVRAFDRHLSDCPAGE